MFKRLLTTLTVVVALAGLVVPVAAAGQSQQASKLGEIGAWAVPSQSTGPSQQTIRDKLGEIGLWAVPSQSTGPSQQTIRDKLGEIGLWAVPSQSTGPSQQTIRDKLGEIGAWAVPATHTTPVVASSDGFDWNNGEIGAGFVLGALLIGVASFVTVRRHHRPIAH
jgi:hypothetical protein